MASIQTMIDWMNQRQGKVTYSMGARMGPSSYDCSSAVYFALRAGKFLSNDKMGTTDTLFSDLEAAGWQQTTEAPRRGDIFIWGVRGASGGSAGHTGIFVGGVMVIHCRADRNDGPGGIFREKYETTWNASGNPPAVIYRNPEDDGNPEAVLDTPEKQNAWTVWKLLTAAGYSPQAIAGVLGNMQVESGVIPDKDQTGGGPAYGLVQWDGSQTALVPPLTSNGRQYVQNLLKAAGINGDYTDATVQTKLLLWTMTNGQWIGAVEPLTVEGFKSCTDVRQATLAFVRNYERAGTEHLQQRYDGADYWYNLLSGLSVDSDAESFESMTNVGHLDFLGIKEGKIYASGWHFSSDKNVEFIEFINAETDAVLARIEAPILQRPDVQEVYPNVLGAINSGFNVSVEVPNGTAVYVKGIRSNGSTADELIFDKIIIFEQAFDVAIDHYAETNTKFYFEILDKGKIVKRGNKILNALTWSNELMYVPSTQILLPIDYAEYFKGREEVKLYINKKVFHGLVTGYELDKVNETIAVDLLHVISEWEYRQVSTNLAAKNRTVNDLYSTLDFRYPGWNMNFFQDSATRVIDYVYSRQDKLEGLTKTCELTDDLFWRVGFHFGRSLEIGTFGDKKPYYLSTKPTSAQNIRIITEPKIIHNFENVVNVATIYGEKSDSGMSSMSLREVYEEKGAQDPAFPVYILRNGINNERGYDYIEFTKLAPNNEIEYSIIDTESVALESATVLEGSFSFNDLAPFNTDGKTITDEDRAKAAKTAYDAAVKRLKESRRSYQIELEIEELPHDVLVGDKIRLLYDNNLLILEECSNYMKKILKMDDWYFITKIDYVIDLSGIEHNIITLEKFLKIDRESGTQ
ncbi:phage tail tip lysozyme [Enterococcus larvae]|uniref:phage tail tip lysozyme n=1 Tax=Enterococcus larvae TaxID=2794352 RepID=UPI003F2B3F11